MSGMLLPFWLIIAPTAWILIDAVASKKTSAMHATAVTADRAHAPTTAGYGTAGAPVRGTGSMR